MKIIYSNHLEMRIKERGFPHEYPNTIYNDPDEKYFDNINNSYIAIKTMLYFKKMRKISIAYIFIEQDVKIKTIHTEETSKINYKLRTGRYIKI